VARERGLKGYEVYLYLLAQKLVVGQGLPADSGYKPENSRPNGLSALGKAGENNHVLLFEWYLCLTKVCLGSLEH